MVITDTLGTRESKQFIKGAIENAAKTLDSVKRRRLSRICVDLDVPFIRLVRQLLIKLPDTHSLIYLITEKPKGRSNANRK